MMHNYERKNCFSTNPLPDSTHGRDRWYNAWVKSELPTAEEFRVKHAVPGSTHCNFDYFKNAYATRIAPYIVRSDEPSPPEPYPIPQPPQPVPTPDPQPKPPVPPSGPLKLFQKGSGALGNFAELPINQQTYMLMVNVIALTRLTRALLPTPSVSLLA